MSEAHTPGPWTLDVNPKGQSRRVFTERIEIWQGNSARLVACMHLKNWSIDGEGDLANARLIAAAPYLLAELQRVYESLGGETYDWGPVREAIAKATGSERQERDEYGSY